LDLKTEWDGYNDEQKKATGASTFEEFKNMALSQAT
jgi:hypothetical protein